MSQAQVWERQALAISIMGGIANRIKLCVYFARKNKELAEHEDFRQFIDCMFEQLDELPVEALVEQLLPQWCRKQMKDGKAINDMHNLIFLLSLKTHQVFQSRVIHQIID
jgi:hypothetical protein